MKQDATQRQIELLVARITTAHLEAKVKEANIEVIGDIALLNGEDIAIWPGVEQVSLTLTENGIHPIQLAKNRKKNWKLMYPQFPGYSG
jgi:hypothetical protein